MKVQYKIALLMLTTGLFTLSCSNAVKSSANIKNDRQITKNPIVGTWKVIDIEHVKSFDINMSMANISFFGTETWETSKGKTFTFGKNNILVTDIFIHNSEPINLFYKLDHLEQLSVSLDTTSIDKSFFGLIKFEDDKMTLTLDDYLKINFMRID